MTWDKIYAVGIGDLGLQPWELGRYTLKQFYFKMKVYSQRRKEHFEQLEYQNTNQWRQVRWQTYLLLKAMGEKELTSLYQLMSLPGDPGPSEPPKENLLKRFPAKLEL